MEITAKSDDPQRAAEMANTLVDLYLNRQLSAIYTPDTLRPNAPKGPKLLSVRLVSEGSPAVSPSSHSALYILGSAALGALMGIGFGIWRDAGDQGVGGFKDAERKVGRAALASVPLVRASAMKELPEGLRDASGYAVSKPMSSYAESFRNLRTALMYTDDNSTPKVICITSARNNEGKTTAALSFARVSAMAGQKVMLVNCDLRGSALNDILRVKPVSGLLDVITGDIKWRDALLKDPLTSLDVLPSAQAHFHPRDVFGSIAMTHLLQELRAEYDLIILDAPSVLSVTEARVISRLADKTLMIVHWTKTRATLVKSAIHVLETTGSDVAGLVLNFVDPRAHGRLSVADTAYQAKYATRYYAS